MNESKEVKVKMELNIAGEQVFVTVPFSRQNSVRKAEKDIQDLFKDWRHQFQRKSTTELLAMMVYQYASYYNDLLDRYDNAAKEATRANKKLDELLTRYTD